MKRIVFINQATGYLTIDIINVFAEYYDEVALIAGSIRVQDIELNKKVFWSRIIKYNRKSTGKKLFSWIVGTFQIFLLLVFKYRNYEIFYISIPPFAYLLSLFIPNKFSVLIFDVYPATLKINGINDDSIIVKIWHRFNRKVFKKAHKVFTIGEGLADLLQVDVNRDRIEIVPLWTGLVNARPIPKRDNTWLKELGLEGKFIVQYSGNIGSTHNVEIVVELARTMQHELDIFFLIIGRGERTHYIKKLIDLYNLPNCSLLPFQPDNILELSLSAADIGIVILDAVVSNVSLPSKIFNLQAVGVPILGISSPSSALAQHISEYKCGRCFSGNDLTDISNFIKSLRQDTELFEKFSENSLSASKEFTVNNAKLYFHKYVSELF